MTYNFKAKAKMAAITAAEVGVMGGSMLLSQKFLSFDVIFKNQIAADPTYKDKWFIKHQGAIKFAAGVLGAIYIPNPWLKLVAVGVAINGLVQEVRVLTMKDGEYTFDAIGNLDKKLLNLANRVNGGRDRNNQTFVAGINDAPTYVALPIDLMNNNYTSVGKIGVSQYSMERGMGVAMLR